MIFPALFMKEAVLSARYVFGDFVKNQLTVDARCPLKDE